MDDCRKSLVHALRVLSTFEDADDFERSPYVVVSSFHHQYAVWRFNFDDILNSIDRNPLDELYRMTDEMLSARRSWKPGWQRTWDPKSVKSGRRWKKLRSLASASLPAAKALQLPASDYPVSNSGLRIMTYNQDHVPNPPEAREMEQGEDGLTLNDASWRSLRQELELACGKHGHVGPDDPVEPAQFWVVDDRYNEERYQYMELHDPECVTGRWLADVVSLLEAYPGWGIAVSNLRGAYVLIFVDRLMVTGKRLRNCSTADDVLTAMKALIVN